MPPPQPVSPYLTRKREYEPKVGDLMTLEMPGDRGRGEVTKVITPNVVNVILTTVPVGRNPMGYAKGQEMQVRRSVLELTGVECWEVVSDREVRQAEALRQLEAEAREQYRFEEEQRIADQRERDLRYGDPADGPVHQPRRVLGPRRSKVTKR